MTRNSWPIAIGVLATSLTIAACNPGPEQAAPQSAPAASPTQTPAPAQSAFAEVGGARHHYELRGDLKSGKTPLVLLHGSFMSAEAMGSFAERFAQTRPVIALDARGHGRTPDIAGPMTYEALADDVAGVLAALGVAKADVLGYSMGGITGAVLAARHPERIGKLVLMSAPFNKQGWYPEVAKSFAEWKPDMLAGSGLEAVYRRLSPTPDSLPALLVKHRAQETAPYGLSDAQVRNLTAKTMIVVGDADGVQLDYAVRMFVLRGGGDREAAMQGMLSAPPRARLAILPGTSHIGMSARPQLVVDVVTPFLDDELPPLPPDFLQPGPGKVPAGATKQ